jgi:hypothetical protein
MGQNQSGLSRREKSLPLVIKPIDIIILLELSHVPSNPLTEKNLL